MKLVHVFYLLVVSVAATDGLSTYVSSLPQCSLKYLKPALQEANCDTEIVDAKLFDCMCKNLDAFAGYVDAHILNDDKNNICLNEFSNAIGGLCGVYDTFSVSVSDWPQATSMFAKDLQATGTSTPTTAATMNPTKTTSPMVTTEGITGNSAGGSATSTSSTDMAPTIMPQSWKVAAGSVAVIVNFII